MTGLLGKKIGMTRIFDNNNKIIPVTVVQAGPCKITQIKTEEKDKYSAVQLAFNETKKSRINKPMKGHLKKIGSNGYCILREFNYSPDEGVNVGDVLKADFFNEGDFVTVSGTTKGKGFQGTVRRHGFRGGPKTHGQSDRHRAPGSIGAGSSPSRVFKGMRMSGHMGSCRRTVRNIQIVKVDVEKNLILLKGSVPGHRNGYLEIRKIY